MEYHILHNYETSAPFKEKSSDHFKDLHKLRFLTYFDVNLTSSQGGVTNLTFNALSIAPPRKEIRLTSKFIRRFSLW